MYLATINKGGEKTYQVRQSYREDNTKPYQYRVVFDLGSKPQDYIHNLSDDICYFAPELEDSLNPWTTQDPTTILEELLWDFLPEEERFRLSHFRNRGKARVIPLSREERRTIEADVHIFDRRRLYYLRYGAVDQSRIFRLNPKLYRPLLQKCRDEREYYLMKLENDLQPNELRTYVFAIFDLQRHFTESFSATMPEALNQITIADFFVEDLCHLNGDETYWLGQPSESHLHDHLIRYLIMFFDYGYGRRSLFDDFVREFMGRHRAFAWPEKRPEVSTSQAEDIFETKWSDLQKMNKQELTRLYRTRAKTLHPDSGGDHERFIALNTAYASLLLRKKQSQ